VCRGGLRAHAQPIKGFAIEEAQLDEGPGLGDVFGPPWGETFGGGDEWKDGIGGSGNLDGMKNVGHEGGPPSRQTAIMQERTDKDVSSKEERRPAQHSVESLGREGRGGGRG